MKWNLRLTSFNTQCLLSYKDIGATDYVEAAAGCSSIGFRHAYFHV